ncbi:hypothetical protein LXA43DRAFT_893256, partial [Ganoderma leucocontextum]
EQMQKRWRSPIYGFFKPEVLVDYKDDRWSHLFQCMAKGCSVQIRRFLDTGDHTSSGNLFKHTWACWTDAVIDHAVELNDAETVRKKLVKPRAQSKSITDFWNAKGQKKVQYSHRPLTKTQTRCVWVAEDLRSFKMVLDRGFLMIAKLGRPGYYVPSPSTVFWDVKVVFVATCKHLVKMLQAYPGKLSFATDIWTSPNHRSFIAVTVHLELKGRPLRMLLDLIELAKSHSGVNLAITC